MSEHHFFSDMTWTTDSEEITHWAPLVMEGREPTSVAATRGIGTEVNYGLLARRMGGWLAEQDDCDIASGWKVTKLYKEAEAWRVESRCLATGELNSFLWEREAGVWRCFSRQVSLNF